MLELPGPPHGGYGSVGYLAIDSIGALSYRIIRVALKHDQRGGAGRMCCCEQRRCRERAVGGDEDRFAAPEIVEHRGDAVGPLLQGRQSARRDGIGSTRARLIEEDQSTKLCHRLDPALNGR
jgi:hypothetical protein